MNLKELADLAERLEGIEARYKALETAILENGAAMAEILELLTKQGPDTAKAIADALKSLTLNMPEQKPAQITVNVPDIRIPDITMPAMPAMPAANDWTKLKVTAEQSGANRTYTITKSK